MVISKLLKIKFLVLFEMMLFIMSCNQFNHINLKPFEEEAQNPLQFISWCTISVPVSVPVQSQTHPSVVYIPDSFMHSNLWLATTPYPKGNIAYENPCVYFNKSLSFVRFSPIDNNPIHARPSAPNAYNSDVDLIYFNHRLYSIIRESWNGKYAREIKVQSSSDGQHWSQAMHVYSNLDTQGKDLLSPSVIQYNNKFYIYHLNGNSGNDPNAKCLGIEIMQGSSLDHPDFTFYKSGRFINQDSLQIEPWHFDLFVYNQILWMVFCGPDHSHGPTTKMFTYLAYSSNFVDFTIFKKPLVSDHSTYRPTAFVDENGEFYLYFSILDAPGGDGRAVGLKECDFTLLLKYLNYYDDPLQL